MLTVINKVDRSGSIPFDSIKIEAIQGDPIGKLSFTLEDPGSQINLVSQQEVIVFDENIALTPSFTVPSPFTDTYSNDASSTTYLYTSTNNPGGSAATWTQTLSSKITASGGASALFLLNNWTAQYATINATMTTSDFGGVAFNVVDTSNYYELSVQDASSPTPNVLQLYKTVAGTRSAIGSSAAISFTRTTSHTITVNVTMSGTSTAIAVLFDGAQKLYYADASPLGSGQVGLRNDVGSGQSSSVYTAFSASSNDVPTLIKSVPAHNYLNNNNFTYAGGAWSTFGSIGTTTFPTNPTFGPGAYCSLSVSNGALGQQFVYQNIPKSYVIVGQQYCLSAQMQISTAFINADAYIRVAFEDVNFTTTGSAKTTFTALTSGYTRVSIIGTAPANTVYIQVQIGVETSVGGSNSGKVAWTGVQLEPVWFPSLYSYPTPICDFLQSDCITIPDGTTSRYNRIFTGNITHKKRSYGGTTRYWEVEATGLDGMLENVTLVNNSYFNTPDQNIIIDIVLGLSPRYLFANDTTLFTDAPLALAYRNLPLCAAGVTLNSIQYSDATLREVLNSLVDISGFLCGVDNYYNVYYYPPFYNTAPYGFSDNPDNITTFTYYDYELEEDGTQLQNSLNISGNLYEVQITESFVAGDGTHDDFVVNGNQLAGFNLKFEPAGTLRLPQVTFGGVSKTTILDTGAGFGTADCMLGGANKGTNGVGIASAINFGVAVTATYTYNALAYVEVQSPDSVAKFGRQFWGKINDTNLASNASAVTRGEAELEAYSDDRITLTFKTQKALTPGQIIEFTSALDGLSQAHYVVQKVTALFLGYDDILGPVNEYQVEAGTYVDDFIDFFRNTQKAVNRATHDPAAQIQQYSNLQRDSISLTDGLAIRINYKPRVFGSAVSYPVI